MNLIPALFQRMGRALVRAAKPAAPASQLPWIVPTQRGRWIGANIAQYTPQQIEQILREALGGNLQRQWEMFDLMESTWPELSQCLNELKDSVLNLRIEVVPWALRNEEPSEEAVRRAKLVDELLWTMSPAPDADENDFEDTVRDLLDARGKGISVLEVEWDTRSVSDGTAIGPRATRWVHPNFYAFNDDGSRLMLNLNDESPVYERRATLMPFPENKFLIGVCKNKTGSPAGAAMLHVLGFWWCAFNFTSDAFFDLAQVFGQPIRWANYDPAMASDDKAKLETMLENMGRAAWAMFPEGVTLELKEAMKSSQDNPQKVLLDMANKICRLVVLRQTLTSDVGDNGSRALGDVHERKEAGVTLACAKWTCKVLQQLVRAICILNFGDDREMPWIRPAEQKESPRQLAEILATIKNAGLEPTDEELPELGERLGFDLQRAAAPPAPGFPPRPAGEGRGEGEPADTEEPESAADESAADEPAYQAAQARMAESLGVPAGWLNPVREFLDELAKKAADKTLSDADLQSFLDRAVRRVPELFARMEVDELARVFEAGMGGAVIGSARKNLRKPSPSPSGRGPG